MVYSEDVRLVVTLLAMQFVSWLVFLRFVNVPELGLLTMSIFVVAWLASITVALIHVSTPLILAFSTISRRLHKNYLHAHTKNAVFICGHVSVWLVFGIVFYLFMQFLGYSLPSLSIYVVVGYAAIIAGMYKLISHDHINMSKIMSPELFFSKHWREGHKGAYAMGAHHAVHIASMYWVLVLILLLAGYSNLLLLGLLSATIFAERISQHPVLISRLTGLCFIVAGLGILMYAPPLLSLTGINQNTVILIR